MTPAAQLDFYNALFRPVLTTAQAAWMLDECSERHILDLLDEGRLRGLNIATKEDTRRDIRIYRYSVLHWLLPRSSKSPLTEVAVEDIFTHHRPTVLRRELADWLSCTEQHISNLALAPHRADARHIIQYPAVLQFLKTRTL